MKQTKAPQVAPSPPRLVRKMVAKGSSSGTVFMALFLDMSYKLAIVVIVPLVLGNYLDQRYKLGFILLIMGAILALLGFVIVLRQSYRLANSFTNSGAKS